MKELACALSKHELSDRTFTLYKAFRPEIPAGTKGWGATGRLDLDKIRNMAE